MSEGKAKFESESGFQKIVGATPDEQRMGFEFAKNIFEDTSGKQVWIKDKAFKVEDVEREKTPEEIQIIKRILESMPEFVKRYGGKPIDITLDHIKILDINKCDEETRKKFKESPDPGGYVNVGQFIYIFQDDDLNRFAIKVAHEVIHFNSFHSLQKRSRTENNLSFKLRRSGLTVIGKDNEFFGEINEALTEELAKRFCEEYGEEKLSEDQLGYSKERGRLNKYIELIFERNRQDFQSSEEIFEIFARAEMSGNLLPLARLLRKTFGKEELRDLANATKNKN
jgi:hypothetical protein